MDNLIEARLKKLQLEIEEECRLCHRSPETVTLVGITKKQPIESISSAIFAGLMEIGESYMQEARDKFPFLPSVKKHFVGHVQTNKAKQIVELFDVVQSVDRPEAVIALAKASQSKNKILPVLIQINISSERRYGCHPENAAELAAMVRAESSLILEGVMAIGPLNGNKKEILSAFKQASDTLAKIEGHTLSLGMSGDWKLAIQAGSTLLRIGTALFGPR